jgi:hypothetical protein
MPLEIARRASNHSCLSFETVDGLGRSSSAESDPISFLSESGIVRFRVCFSKHGPEVHEVPRYINVPDSLVESLEWDSYSDNSDDVVGMPIPHDELEAELGPPCSNVPLLMRCSK